MADVTPKTNPEVFLTHTKLRAARREKNREVREFTEKMDLSAQDNHSKSERFSFAVVGEGTKSSHKNFRDNYPDIDWSN